MTKRSALIFKPNNNSLSWYNITESAIDGYCNFSEMLFDKPFLSCLSPRDLFETVKTILIVPTSYFLSISLKHHLFSDLTGKICSCLKYFSSVQLEYGRREYSLPMVGKVLN